MQWIERTRFLTMGCPIPSLPLSPFTPLSVVPSFHRPIVPSSRCPIAPLRRPLISKLVYHRLEPEDAFTAYDPTHSGTITEAVFRRGLGDAFRMPFTERQLSDLSDRYRVGENKAGQRRVEWCYSSSSLTLSLSPSRFALCTGGESERREYTGCITQ